MKKTLFIALLIFSSSLALLLFINPSGFDLHDIYDKKLQVPLFTGFLTLGSFLLTLKTFVIVKLKEELYDSIAYKERIKKNRLLQPDLESYAPLSRLAKFLVYTVILALITSVAQMTIGFLPYRIASAVCISFATTTLMLVIYAWWLIKDNLAYLFKMWEEQSKNTQSTQV
jgi:hypothetical protein